MFCLRSPSCQLCALSPVRFPLQSGYESSQWARSERPQELSYGQRGVCLLSEARDCHVAMCPAQGWIGTSAVRALAYASPWPSHLKGPRRSTCISDHSASRCSHRFKCSPSCTSCPHYQAQGRGRTKLYSLSGSESAQPPDGIPRALACTGVCLPVLPQPSSGQ